MSALHDLSSRSQLTPISIRPYRPEYAKHFERLNKQWIEQHFRLEARDLELLEHPEETILAQGGQILFALAGGDVIGTVALLPSEPGTFELSKMAVDPQFRNHGTGMRLCRSALDEAKALEAQRVILYSNTRLASAIQLYRRAGFIEVPVEPGVYERANIKMELSLVDSLTSNKTSHNHEG